MKKPLYLVIIALVLIADQTTKQLARDKLPSRPPRHFGVLTMFYAENRGAFLSLGTNFSESVRVVVLDVVVGIGLIAATVVLFRAQFKRGDDVALAAIIGGGIGNLIDRLRFGGRVTDFLYVAAGRLHTGVFNLADMAITFGVLWLLASWIFSGRNRAIPPQH